MHHGITEESRHGRRGDDIKNDIKNDFIKNKYKYKINNMGKSIWMVYDDKSKVKFNTLEDVDIYKNKEVHKDKIQLHGYKVLTLNINKITVLPKKLK